MITKTVLFIFGTRPEAIKMCPLVRELKERRELCTLVCVSGQHRQLLDGVLSAFCITPDFDLSLMRDGQTLSDITCGVLSKLQTVLAAVRPDLVLVHGDTSTSLAAALACFYRKIPVGHVEAGLRTYNINSPFPEEFNRRATSLIAQYHFAPTDSARDNLLREGVQKERIFVTGNTVIDALKTTVHEGYTHPLLEWAQGNKLILLTTHRRESIGETMRGMLSAVRKVVDEHPETRVVCTLHPNPAVTRVIADVLSGHRRICLTAPLDVLDFHNIMARSYLILTDSGGIQEEATALGKPVLVLRDTTERPEGVSAGALRLVGTEAEQVYACFCDLLCDSEAYNSMSRASSLYGDGTASKKIADIIVASICSAGMILQAGK